MAAVYDEMGPNTIAYFAAGDWDPSRRICVGATDFSRSEMKGKSAREAALQNSQAYVIYVIDRNRNLVHAPCGVQLPDRMLRPGTYNLDTYNRTGPAGDYGPGGICGITGI